MRPLLRITLFALAAVVASSVVAPLFSQNVSADPGLQSTMYGRDEYRGYFQDGSGGAWACDPAQEGHLICGGIPGSVNSTQTFLEFYWVALYGDNVQNNRSAAFTILTMLGINGPNAGGSYDAGVAKARDLFGTWEARVRSYGNAGKIEFSTDYTFWTNTAFRNGDVVWYNLKAGKRPQTATSVVFTLANGSKVAIKRSCANLVGAAELTALDYSLSAESSVDRSSASVGDRLLWTHKLNNNGPANTNQRTYSNLGMSGFNESGWVDGASDKTIEAGAGVGTIRSDFSYGIYDVQPKDGGRNLCQRVQYSPTNSSGGVDGRGPWACAYVPFSYTLYPSVTLDRDVLEVGSTVGMSASVRNSGPTWSDNTEWRFSYVTANSLSNIPTAGQSAASADPCTYLRAAGRTCSSASFSSGGIANGSQVFQVTTQSLGSRTAEVRDLSVGTWVCYVLSTKARSSSDARWEHSAPDCAVVSKRPLTQVRGGDIIVGRGSGATSEVRTNVKTASGKSFGSWGEYGIVASGSVRGMASGAGYAGGPDTPASMCNVSVVTFKNANATGVCTNAQVGGYRVSGTTPPVVSRFPVNASTTRLSGDVALSSRPANAVYGASGEIRLKATTINAGNWYVINAQGSKLYIDENITYANGPFASVSELPQVVIIADDIIIADRVTQIDAWLVAVGTGVRGVVNTCGSGGVNESTTPHAGQCDKPLQVNGPVMANRLLMKRTAGAGTGASSGEPAEVFNLRPDAYLWASNVQSGTAKARTVMTKELPPRY